MKIRFTQSRWLDTEDREKEPLFVEGSTHDLNAASAERWLLRGVAVVVVDTPKLRLNRPMMGEPRPVAVISDFKPKKTKRPKKGA